MPGARPLLRSCAPRCGPNERRRMTVATEVTIQRATPDDAEAMVELEHASAIHHSAIDPGRWRVPSRQAIAGYRQRRRELDPDGEALLAVADGQVVGMVELFLRGF